MSPDTADKRRRFLVNMAFFAVIVALVFLFFRYILKLMMPFFIALVFASLSRPLARKLSAPTRFRKNEKGEQVEVPRRVKLNSTFAGVFSVVVLFLVIGSVLVLLIIRLSDTVTSLFASLPGVYTATVLPVLESLAGRTLEFAGRLDESVVKTVEGAIPNLITSVGSAVTRVSMNVVTWVSSLAGRIPYFLLNTIICLIATVFIAVDFTGIEEFIRVNLSEKNLRMVIEIKDTFLDMIWQFIRSYAIIFVITTAEITAGLLIIGTQSPLFIAVLIAIFDAFPIVGSGMILAPWAVFTLVSGELWRGVGLLILYAVVVIVRQVIEPRIVGKHVGLNPLLTLVCMYSGTKLFGGIGLLAMPVAAAILVDMNDRGLIHFFTDPKAVKAEEEPHDD